jgi:hypothetical protein
VTPAWHQLSPRDFEEAVAWLLANQGYEGVEVIGGAGDLGVDIRCYDQGGNLVVVQCKRYAPNKRIGSPVIQHFMAMARAERVACRPGDQHCYPFLLSRGLSGRWDTGSRSAPAWALAARHSRC